MISKADVVEDHSWSESELQTEAAWHYRHFCGAV